MPFDLVMHICVDFSITLLFSGINKMEFSKMCKSQHWWSQLRAIKSVCINTSMQNSLLFVFKSFERRECYRMFECPMNVNRADTLWSLWIADSTCCVIKIRKSHTNYIISSSCQSFRLLVQLENKRLNQQHNLSMFSFHFLCSESTLSLIKVNAHNESLIQKLVERTQHWYNGHHDMQQQQQ